MRNSVKWLTEQGGHFEHLTS